MVTQTQGQQIYLCWVRVWGFVSYRMEDQLVPYFVSLTSLLLHTLTMIVFIKIPVHFCNFVCI